MKKTLFLSTVLPIILMVFTFMAIFPSYHYLSTLLLPILPSVSFLIIFFIIAFIGVCYGNYLGYSTNLPAYYVFFQYLSLFLFIMLFITFFISKDISWAFLYSILNMLVVWYVNYLSFKIKSLTGYLILPYSVCATFYFYFMFAIFMLN